VKAAGIENELAMGGASRLCLCERLLPNLRIQVLQVKPLAAQLVARRSLGISSKEDVYAAPSHVGGDSHRAWATGLRDDLRFALVVLGIQNLMGGVETL
jgi:hypothetical protein